jgi:hypothetical protein
MSGSSRRSTSRRLALEAAHEVGLLLEDVEGDLRVDADGDLLLALLDGDAAEGLLSGLGAAALARSTRRTTVSGRKTRPEPPQWGRAR